MRPTLAGYAFSLFYEDGSQPPTPFLILEGAHHYPRDPSSSDAQHGAQRTAREIFVPFPPRTRTAVVVLCDGTGAASAVEVCLQEESYVLQVRMSTRSSVPNLSPSVGVLEGCPWQTRNAMNGRFWHDILVGFGETIPAVSTGCETRMRCRLILGWMQWLWCLACLLYTSPSPRD